ncbi:tRNA(Met) cytidine acetyltransferase TmcA [Bisbaumannia pacifica]|nr:GNAT family N-acetyltransferase [Halomonas pacifica]MBH8581459.1 tRNA(Met) cytidine acetyltransferase [Halomonas pacifica]
MTEELAPLLAWHDALAERQWRGLVWLAGDAEACRARALALWNAAAWGRPLWVADHPPAGVAEHGLPPGKARTRLGGEHDLIVFAAQGAGEGFDPEAFGALAGTLRAGGLLVLLTPADWGAAPDADYRRLAEHPYRVEQLSARYLARLARLLADAPEVLSWRPGILPQPPRLGEAVPVAPSPDGDCLTRDQAEAVARLVKLRRRRPLVLTADRGRGKSAALGIACARWLAAGEPRIFLTAPRPAALEALFERLAALCPEGRRQGNDFRLAASGQAVTFLAPDALMAALEAGEIDAKGGLLLVDEAAAIPAPLLGRWLGHFPRLVFATTVHGYEGSGRGFALRFREHLERQAPQWQGLRLLTPVRWAPGDPLEALTDRLLLLDAEPADPPAALSPVSTLSRRRLPLLDAEPADPPAALPPASTLSRRRLRRAELAADEPRLRALFGLLVQAHYRTQPSDLRQLLDGPGVHITSLEANGAPLGVTLCVEEGGFSAELAERVARGERRPRGHLLAQSLAAHAGSRAALRARLRRVMRIAVHGDCRRQGLGEALLAGELAQARHDGIDLLGASFGAEPGLLAFWRAAGFRTVRLGLTREAASGEHALMVVCPTSPAGEALAAALAEAFQALLPSLLAFELEALDPELALALLAEGAAAPLTPGQRRDLEDVAFAKRAPALARPALQAALRRALACGAPRDDHAWLLVAALFQGRDTAWLARTLGLSGRREVEARLRRALAALVPFLDAPD